MAKIWFFKIGSRVGAKSSQNDIRFFQGHRFVEKIEFRFVKNDNLIISFPPAESCLGIHLKPPPFFLPSLDYLSTLTPPPQKKLKFYPFLQTLESILPGTLRRKSSRRPLAGEMLRSPLAL